jgi:hypothetical protein
MELMSTESISCKNASGDTPLLLALKLNTPKSLAIAKMLVTKSDLSIRDSIGKGSIGTRTCEIMERQ